VERTRGLLAQRLTPLVVQPSRRRRIATARDLPHVPLRGVSGGGTAIVSVEQDGVVGVLDQQTYQGGTRGSRLCGGDRDQETENSKVRARTRDTKFIQVRVAKVANPTSCLGDQVWRLRLVLFPGGIEDVRLGTRPSFI
jgi:hypothetical protein